MVLDFAKEAIDNMNKTNEKIYTRDDFDKRVNIEKSYNEARIYKEILFKLLKIEE